MQGVAGGGRVLAGNMKVEGGLVTVEGRQEWKLFAGRKKKSGNITEYNYPANIGLE